MRPLLERISHSDAYPAAICLWLLAQDSVERSEASDEVSRTYYETYKKDRDLQTMFDKFNSLEFTVQNALVDYIKAKYLEGLYSYFEGSYEYRFINAQGIEKLKREWPDIWKEFGFDDTSESAIQSSS